MNEIRVLLIDDTEAERRAVARYLRSAANFQVEDWATGEEALEHLKSAGQDYTAVLLDYVLAAERMAGDKVLQKIKADYPYLPVVVFTGVDPARGVQALSQGAYRYLQKPLDLAELVSIVRNLAEQEAIFRRMAQDVRQMLGSDMCLAWRLDGRTRRFQIVAWDGDRDLDAEYRRTTFLDLDAEATQKVFEKKEPIFLRNVQDPRSAPHYRHRNSAEKQGWKSLISIPLVRQERVIGLVDSYTRRELDQAQVEEWVKTTLPPFARQAAAAAWNAELSDRLQALQGLNEVLAGTFEEGTILRQILAKGIELVAGLAGWVYKLDINQGKLILKESLGVEREQVGGERDLGTGISGYVAQKGQALNVPDVTWPSGEYQHLEIPGLEVRSEVAVPLRRGEQTVGVLTVTSPLPNAFTNEEVGLLSALAAQAAMAISQADVARHSQKLGRLALTGDFDQVADYVVEAARDLTGADVILWRMSEQEEERGRMLRVKAYRGNLRPGYPDKADAPIALDAPTDASHPSITSLALARGEPIVRRDIQDESEAPGEPRFHNLPAAEQHGWRGFMAVPLLTREGQPLGSLSLYGKEKAKFGEAEVSLMQAFADQICVALQNAAQYDMLRRLNEIGQELSRVSLSPREVLTQIAQKAFEALEADTVDLYQYQPEQDRFDLPPIMVGRRLHPESVTRQVFPEDVVVKIVNSRKPVFASEAQKDPILAGELETPREGRPKHRFVVREKILSSAGIPLVAEEKVVGVLFVGYRRKRDFDAEVGLKDRINLFAHQAATAIGNARLMETVRNRNRVMKQLLDVGPAIGKLVLPKTKTALSRIALSLCDQVGADSVVIYPYDPQRPGFWDEDNVASYGLWYPLVLVDKPRERGLSARIRDEKWVEINDISSLVEQPKGPHPLLKEEEIQTFVGVALQHQGQDMGVLYVNFREPHSFSEEEKVKIREHADQAAQEIAQAARVEGLTLPGLLEDILSKARESLGADLVILHRYHRGRDEEFVGRPLVAGTLKDPDRTKQRPLLTAAPRQVIEKGEYYAEDVSQHEFYTSLPAGKSLFVEREEIRSACGIPLQAENENVGVLFVNYRQPHKFDDDTRQTIRLFAEQLAITIRNARLLAQTQALQEIAEQLAEFTLKPQRIYGLILERALDLIGFSRGWISIWDKTTDRLEMKAAKGLKREEWRGLPSSKGIVGHVARTGQTLRVDDIKTIEFYEEFFSDTLSELCVPIIYQGEVLGVLNVESARPAAFSGRDEELLTTLAEHAALAIHNAQVLEERERESRSLRALHEIGKKINTEHQVQPILNLLVPQAMELIGMSSGIVYLVDPEAMRITHRFGYPAGFEHQEPRLSGETSLTRTVIEKGNPIVIEDTSKDDRVNPKLKDQVKSMLAWPIHRGERRIGVLFLNGDRARTFSDWENALLDALSEQVTIAVENAQLYEQLDYLLNRRIKSLQAVSEVGRHLTANIRQGEAEILKKIYEQAGRVMDTNNMYIALYDEATDEVRFALAYLNGKPVDTATAKGWGPRRCGQGRTEWIIRHRQPLLDKTKAESEAWYAEPGRKEYIGQPFASWVGVPMVVGDKVLGVIATYHATQERVYDEEDMQVLSMMADYAAIALDNARLIQELDRLRELSEELSVGVWLGEGR